MSRDIVSGPSVKALGEIKEEIGALNRAMALLEELPTDEWAEPDDVIFWFVAAPYGQESRSRRRAAVKTWEGEWAVIGSAMRHDWTDLVRYELDDAADGLIFRMTGWALVNPR